MLLHRNGWWFFKHAIEIHLYLQIQTFSLICWTKSTPKEVPSLQQTFNFAEKLMTHLRFNPLEKKICYWFCFLHEQSKMKFSLSSARGLQEDCWGTAAEADKRKVESTRGATWEGIIHQGSETHSGLGEKVTQTWCECFEWGKVPVVCVCRRWNTLFSMISACLMPSAHLPFCHNSVV